ncbi:UDP-N-acetylmuramate--alanine ligase, partial [candidate division MSBL1 archaeon SCGC-AAA385M11]
GDDERLKGLMSRVKRPMVTYGLGPDNDLQGEILESGALSRFRVRWKGREWGGVSLSQPGEHNVQNALGVIGLSIQAGLPREAIVRGLENFGGVGRRLELKGERWGVLVMDDYGHHPTEIALTLKTVRQMHPDRRLVVLFQPHRFTRTKALFGDFCRSFQQSDLLILTEIYPAAEDPIPGVSGLSLAQGIRQVSQTEVLFGQDFDHCLRLLSQRLGPGDVFLTLGAGNIWKVGESLLQLPDPVHEDH